MAYGEWLMASGEWLKVTGWLLGTWGNSISSGDNLAQSLLVATW